MLTCEGNHVCCYELRCLCLLTLRGDPPRAEPQSQGYQYEQLYLIWDLISRGKWQLCKSSQSWHYRINAQTWCQNGQPKPHHYQTRMTTSKWKSSSRQNTLTDGLQANPKIKATATVTAKRRKRKSQKESDPPAQKMRSQPRPSNMKRRKWRGKRAVIQNLRKKSKNRPL